MGIVTAGGTPETNGTVGTVVLKLSNPVYVPTSQSSFSLKVDMPLMHRMDE